MITYRALTGWPWKETESRRPALFKVSFDRTKRELRSEIFYQSQTEDIIIELDLEHRDIRQDGQVRRGRAPRSPKAVVTFQDVEHGWVRYHADQYTSWRDNVRGIRMILQALRSIDRWGGNSGEQYAGFVVSQALTGHVMTTAEAVDFLLKVCGEVSDDQAPPPLTDAGAAKRLVLASLKITHPDNGGSAEQLLAVQQCRDVLSQHHGATL